MFALDFMQYIIDPMYKWAVCMDVPYGTALWQVGDSSGQNGVYKMALAKGKEELTKRN